MNDETTTPVEGVKLSKCPFCDGRAVWKQGYYTGYVMCLSCEAMGPNINRADAEAAWNRRAPTHGVGRVEVARIVDPEAWADADKWAGKPKKLAPGQFFLPAHEWVLTQPSLAKADTILATFEGSAPSPAPPITTGNGSGDRDTLLDICDRLQDEGDRVYLGSTNDAEALRMLGRRMWATALPQPDPLTVPDSAANADTVEIDPSRVRDVLDEGDGFWRTCSGCHESDEGQDVGHYPFSGVFNCKLGGGCGDCGGIGAIWDTTDYEAMGREIAAREEPPEPPWPPGADNGRREGWQCFFAGRGREDCPFPGGRADLQRKYREGWDAASKAGSLS